MNAAAISVKTRDDAPSNNGTPATWTGGDLVISDGTIDTTSTGIRAGETNKNVAGPPVDINGVTITNALHDAQNGDVVVALAGTDEAADEATVKRFFRETHGVRLQPENDSLEPIYAPHVQVLGKVIGVFRRL